MQSPKFFDNQRLYARLLAFRNTFCHGLLNEGKCLKFRMRDDFANSLLDEITPCQAKRVGLSQVLLDGQVFLRLTFVGPDVKVTQQFHASHFVHTEGGPTAGLLRHV